MTPAARYGAAIEVLERWQGGTAVERALTNWARAARYAGSGDRAAVRDHVYDVLRCRASCAALGGGDGARALVLGLVRLSGGDPGAVFTGQGHAPAALAPDEVTALPMPADPLIDTPGWLRPRLLAQYGEGLAPLMAAMARRAPVYLRVNLRKADPDRAIAALARDGITAEPVADCVTALLVTAGARRLRHAAAYLDGLVEVQDLSVQRACAAVDWPRAGRILDFCAGAGGKALAIAATSPAQVFVHDAAPRRMVDLPARAARAGVVLRALSAPEVAGAGRFELVLCDVPCSGSGTWRRDPEAKWHLTPERLADLCATQAAILDRAAGLVAPGGRLVYMTCSLLEAENAAQIDAALARWPGWAQTSAAQDTPLTASDGFFHAELRAPGG